MAVLLKIAKWVLSGLTIGLLTIYVVRAFDARLMSDLGPEHLIEFAREFNATQEDETDWATYLAIERELAVELENEIDRDARPESLADRFRADSLTSPDNYQGNWNHSYEMTAATPRGVAVLLHGLTDSPYSMLSTAQVLVAAGYNVVVPRMPGHGFAVGGLLQARWEDWTAAVRVAVRHAMDKPGAEQSFIFVGYSNGGLLAVDYALRCDEFRDLPCPNGLVLLSPAIAISPFAMTMNWHAAISWIPFFEKFKWLSILPEIDPFKFTSFPKRAAWEIRKISKRTHALLEKPAEVAKLPPILTFQSIVDNTISEWAIVDSLYNRMPSNGSELVVYDINRNSTLLHLMKTRLRDPAEYLASSAPLKFGVTILRNKNPDSLDTTSLRLAAGQNKAISRKTNYRWPDDVYSLSHIAVPFRDDDLVYGNGNQLSDDNRGVIFGALAPRGEAGVLRLSSDYFLRMRYNPFFGFQASELTEWLNEL